MTDVNNVGVRNFGYVTNNKQVGFEARQAAAYSAPVDYEPDSYESSDKKHTAATIAIVSIPVAVAGLWLTKGKGWSKLKNMLGHGSQVKPQSQPAAPAAPRVTQSKAANDTLARQKTKIDTGVSLQEAQAKVDAAIAGVNTPPKAPVHQTIRNVETSNAGVGARNEVARAIEDTPSPIQQQIYNSRVAHQAPTEAQAKVIQNINSEAAIASSEARQVGNIIPESQAAAIRAAAGRDSSTLNGVFQTKKGFTVTYENGTLKSIVAPDGRKITKPQTLYKYQDKIDIANLIAIAA